MVVVVFFEFQNVQILSDKMDQKNFALAQSIFRTQNEYNSALNSGRKNGNPEGPARTHPRRLKPGTNPTYLLVSDGRVISVWYSTKKPPSVPCIGVSLIVSQRTVFNPLTPIGLQKCPISFAVP